jgi:hypothetical protein
LPFALSLSKGERQLDVLAKMGVSLPHLSLRSRRMSSIRILIAGVFALSAASAFAGESPVVVKTEAPKSGGTSTLNLQTSQGSSCSAPSVGACGACSISCPTGQAASCKVGTAVGAQADASCLQPPECKCQ